MSYMPDRKFIEIEVAYARPDSQLCIPMRIPVGTTARQAVLMSDIQRRFPDIDLSRCDIGVYGRVVEDAHELFDGDRLEVYRPLQMDPREARRRLAARGETMSPLSRARSARHGQ